MTDSSRAVTTTPRYAYLGPEGTFTEAALRSLPESVSRVLTPVSSVPAALESVRRGESEAAMVAIENSVEGAIPITLDELASGSPLVIVREVLLPIAFALLARPDTDLKDVKRVTGHSAAQAQVRRWLAEQLPDAEWESSASNAEGARQVQEGRYDAAFAAEFAAERYGLRPLATEVHDAANAVTRFVLVARPGRPASPTGRDKTSLVAFLGDDHPGALLELLQEFSVRGVNLTKIESRPTGAGLGRYFFFVDCDGHIDEARVGEALSGLRRTCPDVRFLGSYPRADADDPLPPRPGTTDRDFGAAAEWLARSRDGRR